MSVPFSEYRAWLASDEYKAQIAKLVGEKPTPPRNDYPIDVGALIAKHEAHADMCIRGAVRHLAEAKRLATQDHP